MSILVSVILLVALGLAVVIFAHVLDSRVKSGSSSQLSTPKRLPYQKKKYLMTFAERSFYDVLKLVVGDNYLIFPQVNLDKLIHVEANTGHYYSYFLRMNRYSVDFVICSRDEISPLVAIELDDRTHQTSRRIARDERVDQILESSGIAYLRVPAQAGYDFPQIKTLVETKLSNVTPGQFN